jgi:hypothetical protein
MIQQELAGAPLSSANKFSAACIWLACLGGDPAHCGDLDLHLVAYVQKRRVRVFQPPGNLRNDDVSPGAQILSRTLHGNGESHGMISSVQSEDALHFDVRISLRLDFA